MGLRIIAVSLLEKFKLAVWITQIVSDSLVLYELAFGVRSGQKEYNSRNRNAVPED
jgi:hypothetical protein